MLSQRNGSQPKFQLPMAPWKWRPSLVWLFLPLFNCLAPRAAQATEVLEAYVNLRLGYPQLASVGLNLSIFDVLHIQLAPGLLASKAGLGLGFTNGLKSGLTEAPEALPIARPLGGIIRAVVLTKNSTWQRQSKELWKGVEADLAIFKVGLEFGVYKEFLVGVEEKKFTDAERKTHYSLAVGIGL